MKKFTYLFAAVLASCSFFASAKQTIAIVGAMDAEITNLLPHIKNKHTVRLVNISIIKAKSVTTRLLLLARASVKSMPPLPPPP